MINLWPIPPFFSSFSSNWMQFRIQGSFADSQSLISMDFGSRSKTERAVFSSSLKVGGQWWLRGEEHNDQLIEFVNTWLNDWVGYVEETVFDVNMLSIDQNTIICNNHIVAHGGNCRVLSLITIALQGNAVPVAPGTVQRSRAGNPFGYPVR